MKHTNRFVCALLSCVMLLAACGPAAGNNDDTSDDTSKDTSKDTNVSDTSDTSSEEDTSIDVVVTDLTFDGRTLNMFGDGRSSHLIGDNGIREEDPDTTGNIMEEAMYRSRTQTEEKYDVKLRYTQYDTDDEITNLINSMVQTGDNTYQLVMARDNLVAPMATTGNLYNLSNISQFDFTQPWYANTTDSLAFGDVRFLGSSFLSFQLMQSLRMLVYNRDIWTDYNMELPYEKLFAGEWYLDDFITACKTVYEDVNSDGNWDGEDVYGFGTLTSELYCWQSSMGLDFVLKDENNLPYFSTEALEKASTYLDKMSELYEIHAATNDFGFGHGLVADGHGLFSYCTMGRIIEAVVEYSDADYGYLPAPKIDETQEDYIFCTTDTYWAIPVSAVSTQEDKDFVGTVIEAYQASNFDIVYPTYVEKALRGNSTAHPEDAQVLDMVPERLVLSFAWSYSYDEGTANIANSCTSNNIASTVAAANTTLTKQLAEHIEAINKIAESQK